jgi:hypothetical protein
VESGAVGDADVEGDVLPVEGFNDGFFWVVLAVLWCDSGGAQALWLGVRGA